MFAKYLILCVCVCVCVCICVCVCVCVCVCPMSVYMVNKDKFHIEELYNLDIRSGCMMDLGSR